MNLSLALSLLSFQLSALPSHSSPPHPLTHHTLPSTPSTLPHIHPQTTTAGQILSGPRHSRGRVRLGALGVRSRDRTNARRRKSRRHRTGERHNAAAGMASPISLSLSVCLSLYLSLSVSVNMSVSLLLSHLCIYHSILFLFSNPLHSSSCLPSKHPLLSLCLQPLTMTGCSAAGQSACVDRADCVRRLSHGAGH